MLCTAKFLSISFKLLGRTCIILLSSTSNILFPHEEDVHRRRGSIETPINGFLKRFSTVFLWFAISVSSSTVHMSCLSVTDWQFIIVPRLQNTVRVCREWWAPPAPSFDDDYYSTLFHTRLESPLSSNAVGESNGNETDIWIQSSAQEWPIQIEWPSRGNRKESNKIADQWSGICPSVAFTLI